MQICESKESKPVFRCAVWIIGIRIIFAFFVFIIAEHIGKGAWLNFFWTVYIVLSLTIFPFIFIAVIRFLERTFIVRRFFTRTSFYSRLQDLPLWFYFFDCFYKLHTHTYTHDTCTHVCVCACVSVCMCVGVCVLSIEIMGVIEFTVATCLCWKEGHYMSGELNCGLLCCHPVSFSPFNHQYDDHNHCTKELWPTCFHMSASVYMTYQIKI